MCLILTAASSLVLVSHLSSITHTGFSGPFTGSLGLDIVHKSMSISISLCNFIIAGLNVVQDVVIVSVILSCFCDTCTGIVSALLDKKSAIVSGSDFTVPTVTLIVSEVIGGFICELYRTSYMWFDVKSIVHGHICPDQNTLQCHYLDVIDGYYAGTLFR